MNYWISIIIHITFCLELTFNPYIYTSIWPPPFIVYSGFFLIVFVSLNICFRNAFSPLLPLSLFSYFLFYSLNNILSARSCKEKLQKQSDINLITSISPSISQSLSAHMGHSSGAQELRAQDRPALCP